METNMWVIDSEHDANAHFELDVCFTRTNLDTSKDRVRLVRYPIQNDPDVTVYFTKILESGIVFDHDGNVFEHTWQLVEDYSIVQHYNDAVERFNLYNDLEYVNTIEDLYD